MTPEYIFASKFDECYITKKDWEDGIYLGDKFSLGINPWEHSLTKEIVLAPGVKATNAEVVAWCLWHTTNNGSTFTKEQKMDFCKYDYEQCAKNNFKIIYENGGEIPFVEDLSPSKRRKYNLLKKKLDRRYNGKFTIRCALKKNNATEYYERMKQISDFIVKVIPAHRVAGVDDWLKKIGLCKLFQSELFYSTEITSFADENTSGANYIFYLIYLYDMLPHFENVHFVITTGIQNDEWWDESEMSEDKLALIKILSRESRFGFSTHAYDPLLGKQIRINYATYY